MSPKMPPVCSASQARPPAHTALISSTTIVNARIDVVSQDCILDALDDFLHFVHQRLDVGHHGAEHVDQRILVGTHSVTPALVLYSTIASPPAIPARATVNGLMAAPTEISTPPAVASADPTAAIVLATRNAVAISS